MDNPETLATWGTQDTDLTNTHKTRSQQQQE